MTARARSTVSMTALAAAACVLAASAADSRAAADGSRSFALANGVRVTLQRSTRPSPAEVVWLVRTAPPGRASDPIAYDVLTARVEGDPAWRKLALLGAMPSVIAPRGATGLRIVSLPSDVERVIRTLATAVVTALRRGGVRSSPAARSASGADARDPIEQAKLQLERAAGGETDDSEWTDGHSGVRGGAGMIVGVLTPLHEPQLVGTVSEAFGSVPSEASIAPAQVPSMSAPSGSVRCLVMPEAQPAVLAIGFVVRVGTAQDRLAWEMFTHMLGGSHTSRLHRRLRLDQPLVYTIAADALPLMRDRLLIRVVTQSKDPDADLRVITSEIDALRAGRWQTDEWNAASAVVDSRAALDREQQTGAFVHELTFWLAPEMVMPWAPVVRRGARPHELKNLLGSVRDRGVHVVVASASPAAICGA